MHLCLTVELDSSHLYVSLPAVWQMWFNFFTVACGGTDSLQEAHFPRYSEMA